MSLIDDLKSWYEDESYPPEGPELDVEHVDGEWVEKGTETKQVAFDVIDDSPRWGDVIQAVYRRDDEYVAVEDVRPATEMQDWGDYGDPAIYPVKPQEVTIVKYVKVY